MNKDLYLEFNKKMNEISDNAEKMIGKRFTKLDQMLKKDSGVNVAIKLISSSDQTTGFLDLYKAKRLDLSIEFLVINKRYNSLFEADIILQAQSRLNDWEYSKNMKIE